MCIRDRSTVWGVLPIAVITLTLGAVLTKISGEDVYKRQIEDITNIVSEAIFLFDDNGSILKYNGTAEEIFLPNPVPGNLSDLIGMNVDCLLYTSRCV